MDVWQVWTVAPSAETARDLANSAVTKQLAAEAKVTAPVTTVVWHHGELIDGEEWPIRFVTTEARYPALEEHLVAEHPWTNPEISAVQLVNGLEVYVGWVQRTASE